MVYQLTKRRSLIPLALLATLAVAVMIAFTSTASGDGEDNGRARYEVTITNVTKGQILSPVVIATHRSRLDPIFELGSPASPELAALAEDAVLMPLIDLLEGSPYVAEVITLTGAGGPILPGETASAVISTRGNKNQISLAGMLVTTNDVFIGLSGVDLPRKQAARHVSPGYDAGSEAAFG